MKKSELKQLIREVIQEDGPKPVIVKAGNHEELKRETAKYSAAHPDVYVFPDIVFGTCYLHTAKKLKVDSPDLERAGFKGYWKAWKFTPFTQQQLKAYSSSLITMDS